MDLFVELIKQIFTPIVAVIAVLLLINFEITVIVEVIKNQELSRMKKLAWFATIILFQPIGVVVYLVAARYFRYNELRYV